MSERPTLSVAMATFNGSAFLSTQLASLAAQTVLPDELVISDDGSTDDTVALVEAFAITAPFRVRLLAHADRVGWRGNFVRAAAACTGDLIAFCDQDDLWYPEKLARVIASFRDDEVLLVHHNADLVDEHGTRYDTLRPVDKAEERIGALSRPTDWSNPLGLVMTFRRRLTAYDDLWPASIDLWKPPNPAAHDQWFYFLATSLGDVVVLPERLLAYRQHGGNSVGWTHAGTGARPLDAPAAIVDGLDRSIGMLTPFCAVLAAIADREDDRVAERARLAHARNRAYLDLLVARRTLYASSDLLERLRIVARLSVDRAYGFASRWGLGRRAWLTDVRYALFGGPSA